eukprot:GHUV01018370.1.p1 GENE.GHUV01018370.1~~GHUV01018370.1.p1  ORF type:complete len:148 (-),score=26.52 GHUV01018370.1:89-532(-)
MDSCVGQHIPAVMPQQHPHSICWVTKHLHIKSIHDCLLSLLVNTEPRFLTAACHPPEVLQELLLCPLMPLLHYCCWLLAAPQLLLLVLPRLPARVRAHTARLEAKTQWFHRTWPWSTSTAVKLPMFSKPGRRRGKVTPVNSTTCPLC